MRLYLMMKSSIRLKLDKAAERCEEVGRMLADPEILGRTDQFRELSMEYARLEPTARAWSGFLQQEQDLAAAEALAADGDAGMRALGAEEAERLRGLLATSEAGLQRMLMPHDPRDSA